MVDTIRWVDGKIRILDQSLLPHDEKYVDVGTVDQMIDAIRQLKVRGAPALGVAGGFALCLGLSQNVELTPPNFKKLAKSLASRITSSRPTAVNLATGTLKVLDHVVMSDKTSAASILEDAVAGAQAFFEDDQTRCNAISRHGAGVLPGQGSVLTHCNTGGLATSGIGTALGVIIEAHRKRQDLHVFVDETRPLLQGSRLTTWELRNAGIRHTLIVDGAAGHVLSSGKVTSVIVGADRIAANGDTANKIGTFSLAVLCEKLRIPFYVAAPFTTVDMDTKNGSEIVIEERPREEVTAFSGLHTAPAETEAYNPAFDVTPAELITAIITEHGVAHGPNFDFHQYN